MNCWEKLCIRPTNDEKKIKLAYAKILKEYRPDDNKDKFMEVRNAYEEAIRLSQMMQDSDDKVPEVDIEEHNNELDRQYQTDHSIKLMGDSNVQAQHIIDMAVTCYESYKERAYYEYWKGFLEEIKKSSIEVKQLLFIPIATFFIQHPYVDCKVLQQLNELFDYTSNEKLLIDELGEEETDYLIYICSDNVFNFKPYVPKGINSKEEAERYLDLRSDFIYELFNDNEESEELLKELKEITIEDGIVDYYSGLYGVTQGVHSKEGYTLLKKSIDNIQNDIGLLLAAGYAALKTDEVDKAIDIFSHCMTIQPKNTHCVKGLAICYYEIGKYMEAVTLFEVLYEEVPYDFTCKTYIVKCYQKIQCSLVNKGNLSKDEMLFLMKSYQALSSYKQAYKELVEIKNTLDAQGLMLLAELSDYIVLMKLSTRIGHYDEAIEALEKEGASLEVAYAKKARVYYKNYKNFLKKSSYDSAKEYIDKSLELKPNQPECYYYLALLQYEKGEYDEALKAIEKAISIINAYKYEYAFLRAQCLYEIKDYDKCYEECIYIDDHSYGHIKVRHTYFMTGVCCYYKGRYQESAEALVKAKEYGYCFSDLKKYQKKVNDKISNGITQPPIDELNDDDNKIENSDDSNQQEKKEIDPKVVRKKAIITLIVCIILMVLLYIASRYIE